MTQLTENRPRGRPSYLNEDELLQWEGVWVELFCNLRDGTQETQVQRRGTSGMLIKASHDQEKMYVSSEGETREQGGRESIYTMIPGEKPKIMRQPKIIESADEMQKWQNKAQRVDDNFQRIVMGDDPRTETIPARPAERHIWEALKRARTAAQVRRTYGRSKIWLKSRTEYPSGGFFDWSWHPYPRELYRRAEEFCNAKLDCRYPARDERPSGDYRRIEYLARVMAGLSLSKPISPSYSVEVLRRIKHPLTCNCWRCVHKIAPRYSRSLVQFLRERTFDDV
jgi:hypothetical protein